MQKALIGSLPEYTPEQFLRLTQGAKIYDSSCSPEASVYYIERDGGLYLKRAAAGTLRREHEMTVYYNSIGLGVAACGYTTEGGYDWLLTEAADGEDLTSEIYMADPARLCDSLASRLRELHETDAALCPIKDRVSEYFALAEANYHSGNYDSSHFPDSFGYRSAEDAIKVLREGKGLLRSDTLIHGDYCLPNIIFNNWRPTVFIDVGNGGIGDRHIDVFWGAWTLGFNLKTDKYRDRFFDAYGRDRINMDALAVVAAAEVFG